MLLVARSVAPTFTERLQRTEAREGQSVRFSVRVDGKPAPEVTWFRESQKIVSSADFEISQDGDLFSLVIPEVFCEDSGKFTAVAENSGGQAVCTAELLVLGQWSQTTYSCALIEHYINILERNFEIHISAFLEPNQVNLSEPKF